MSDILSFPQKQNVPPQNDIVEVRIRLPRNYYTLLSEFAKFLHNQPAQDPQTGRVIIDPKTNKPVPSMPGPNIESYLVTCGLNTYHSYQQILQMAKARQAQAVQAAQTGNVPQQGQ